MKKWLIPAGIIALLLIGGYFVLSYYGVKLIQTQLQKRMGPGMTIAEIQVRSTHLSAKGIRYEDPQSREKLLEIEELKIYPDITSFLGGGMKIRAVTMVRPSFNFSRSKEGSWAGAWGGMEKEEGKDLSRPEGDKERESFHLKIEKIRIEKGSVDFEDRKTGEPSAQIRLRDLDLEIRNLQYPVISAHSPMLLKSKIKGMAKDGEIHSEGWLDLKTMDMETSFQVREMEVKLLEPYYRKRVSAEIESGHIYMDAKITLEKKVINAPGRLELVNLKIKEEGTVLWIPAKTIASVLKDKGDRIKTDFHVKGRVDDPRFSLQENFLNRVGFSLAETFGIPIKGVVESLFKGDEEGTETLKEGVKAIERLLKKKKEKKR